MNGTDHKLMEYMGAQKIMEPEFNKLKNEIASLRAEVERLSEDLGIAIDERNGLSDYIFKMKPRIRQLEEAVEWVLDYRAGPSWAGDLRRKAGM